MLASCFALGKLSEAAAAADAEVAELRKQLQKMQLLVCIAGTLGCSFGDLVSRLSNGPYGAYNGLFFGLILG